MRVLNVLLGLAILGAATGGFADDPPSAVASVKKLLKSGKVPEARLASIVEIVGTRGNEHDLAYLFGKAVSADWPIELRRKAMGLLVDAAQNRKVIPKADLSLLSAVIQDSKAPDDLRLSALRLAASTQAKGTIDAAGTLAVDESAAIALRTAAIDSLVVNAPTTARTAIDELTKPNQPFAVRSAAISSLAVLDLDAAASATSTLLTSAGERDDPAVVVDAVLARRGGAEQLAAAIEKQPVTPDVAKLVLRHMYSVGRSDESLSAVLGRIAGIDAESEPLTTEQMAAMIEEIREKGDAMRGEAVFRRGDLSCMKCHAVSAAGGQVGPDLSAVGTISPVEFLATSILNPDAAIKEAFITRVVATIEGSVLQGIVVNRSAERLELKDATGLVHAIAAADIDQEVEGKSLMPKGLVKFMTHAEFVDLVKFLSLLGRPGDYAIRTTPRFQRYRVLTSTPRELIDAVPNDEQFEASVSRAQGWVPLYARVNGSVPMIEAVKAATSSVVYLSAEFDVTKGGPVGIRINDPEGVSAWIDDDSQPLSDPVSIEAAEGRRRITLRIDTRSRSSPDVLLELVRIPGSSAEFRPVDGA